MSATLAAPAVSSAVVPDVPKFRFRTESESLAIAEVNASADPEWTYKVVPSGPDFLVEVLDESGVSLGFI